MDVGEGERGEREGDGDRIRAPPHQDGDEEADDEERADVHQRHQHERDHLLGARDGIRLEPRDIQPFVQGVLQQRQDRPQDVEAEEHDEEQFNRIVVVEPRVGKPA